MPHVLSLRYTLSETALSVVSHQKRKHQQLRDRSQDNGIGIYTCSQKSCHGRLADWPIAFMGRLTRLDLTADWPIGASRLEPIDTSPGGRSD